ncbi:hypothetical protein [Actinomadura madurae]|uniref:hypothetical protein n=1 Tax=Actinomadura madurae TaxID=1993 RepID=UPI000D9C8B49|nr:hypothetical protein [Actinomadura madurae]SPT59975.1 Uncharacterised protein [Actinomadura madurae]
MTYRGFQAEPLVAEPTTAAPNAAAPRQDTLSDFEANPNIDPATIHTLMGEEGANDSA